MTIQTLFGLSEKLGINLAIVDNSLSTQEQVRFKEWLNVNWKTLLKGLKSLLAKDADETTTQSILNTFQKAINLFGSLNFPQARDSFLLVLCQACLPSSNT